MLYPLSYEGEVPVSHDATRPDATYRRETQFVLVSHRPLFRVRERARMEQETL